ncbi:MULTISPECIES: phosphoglucomutase/phosphomannomutase family protein [Halolamina]|uniref:Phosphomannomutase n=1 Tax=Halolamina pelagica TaxID=699431 RepID=A0A1I5PPF4_9EURY|nr:MULTISPECIES: phosphoglucomutase/phosphomannomutase family protein [Halolamina]NHX34901.1 phosphoglucomutase/phosphomannomutase family protein [Halolamina sp. R1-12]SFP35914.1 Phosphomannomutase [Halolamina pelagica]
MTDPTEAIQFGTDGWRATLDSFTDDRVRIVAQGVADYLREEGAEGPVVVGYDARPSSPGFAESVADVLTDNGFDVLLPERDVPTPTAVWTVVDRDCAGAVILSASHNPPEYNGIKYFPGDGAPAMPAVTDRIEANLREPEALPESERGSVTRDDLIGPHSAAVEELVASYGFAPDAGNGGAGVGGTDEGGEVDLSGLTVAYDAMHGSGRGVTDEVLEAAGAEVQRLRCEADPEFGGGAPEPSESNLHALVDRVVDGEADIGIANDGDADRIAVATPEGYLGENRFFAATYDALLGRASGPAVRTVSTTFLIDRIAEAHGEDVIETAVGFKWVADAMGEHDALMAGEESGGFSIRGHVREKDGVLMALLACAVEAEESYDDRISRLETEHGGIVADKISLDCPDSEKSRVLDDLEDVIPDEVAGVPVERTVTVDGFKLLCEDGSWLLVRPSGTEPKLRVYAEASTGSRVQAVLDAGRELVAPLV